MRIKCKKTDKEDVFPISKDAHECTISDCFFRLHLMQHFYKISSKNRRTQKLGKILFLNGVKVHNQINSVCWKLKYFSQIITKSSSGALKRYVKLSLPPNVTHTFHFLGIELRQRTNWTRNKLAGSQTQNAVSA